MSDRGDINNSEGCWFDDFIPKKVSEIEMTNMIRPHLSLQSFLSGFSLRNSHNSSIVDKIVNILKGNIFGKITYRFFGR